MKEYRNAKKTKGWRGYYYDADLWIDGIYVMPVTLSEVAYREDILMNKLETSLDKETLEEIKEVMQLKYQEGSLDTHDEYAGDDL